MIMATNDSTSTIWPWKANNSGWSLDTDKTDFDQVKPFHQQHTSLFMSSRERYGSRSFERSLQHTQGGFHNPLKSLSPLAARLAAESDTETEPEEDFELSRKPDAAAHVSLDRNVS